MWAPHGFTWVIQVQSGPFEQSHIGSFTSTAATSLVATKIKSLNFPDGKQIQVFVIN